jgi:hypothetical protein
MADIPTSISPQDLYRQQAELAKEREELESIREVLKIVTDAANDPQGDLK